MPNDKHTLEDTIFISRACAHVRCWKHKDDAVLFAIPEFQHHVKLREQMFVMLENAIFWLIIYNDVNSGKNKIKFHSLFMTPYFVMVWVHRSYTLSYRLYVYRFKLKLFQVCKTFKGFIVTKHNKVSFELQKQSWDWQLLILYL